MPRDLRAYLWDIVQAATDIEAFTSGKDFETYCQHTMVRAAVERKFEIIGEAVAQIARHFPDVVAQVPGYQVIIAFRNRLIHGYDTVSDTLVWDVIQTDLPILKRQAQNLLESS